VIHELRTYTLVPGGTHEYLRIYDETARALQTRTLGNLVALMVPESGDLNQLVFLWAYDSHEARASRRAQLMADPGFTEFRKSVRHLMVRQDSRLLTVA